MFDIGWTEMLVIAVVMIVVVGPKDLPKMLRTFGKTTAKLRAMAGDFQRQFNEALKEAELDDVKKSVDELRSLNPASTIRKHLNPFEQAGQDMRAGLDTLKSPASKPAEPATPISKQRASPEVHPAEPLKNGAAGLPGVNGPEAMPAAPLMTPLNGAAPAAAATPAVAAEVASANPAPEKPASKKARAAPKAAAKANGKASAAKAAASKPRAAAAKAKAPVKSVTAKPATRKKADAS